MGEGSDAARAQVLAAREALADELERLEASARTAVDVPAKVRRNPGKAVGVAAGAGFLLVGGALWYARSATVPLIVAALVSTQLAPLIGGCRSGSECHNQPKGECVVSAIHGQESR